MKFNVSLDLLVPVLLEIEAASEDAAVEVALEMNRRELLDLADKSHDAIGVVEDSIDVSQGEEDR